jgi:HK97 family phage major capsid protein
MKWQDFLDFIKSLDAPYRGDGEYDDVVHWLKMNGHDHEAVQADGQSFPLKELWDRRPGKPLDVTTAALKAKEEETFNQRFRTALAEARALEPKTLQHDIKVGKDRVADDPKGGFSHRGEFFSAIIKAGQGKAEGVNELPTKLDAWHKGTLSTYGNETVGADGGFAVPEVFRTEIMVKVQGEDSILSRTDQLTTSSNSLSVPYDNDEPWNTSGIQHEWSGEASTHTQRKPLLEQRTLKLRKLIVLVPLTDELVADAPGIGSYVASKAADVIDFAVGEAIFRGTGGAQPLGFLNGAGTVSQAKESSQAADTILGMNIINMWSRMYGPWKRNAVWFASPTAFPELQRASVTGRNASGGALSAWGGFVMMPANGVIGSPFQTIFGRPVIETEHCEEVGDVGDIVLASMGQYATLTKGNGVESSSSIHLWYDQDVTALKFRLRLDGQPWSDSAVVPRDTDSSAKTLGAFVTLAARA